MKLVNPLVSARDTQAVPSVQVAHDLGQTSAYLDVASIKYPVSASAHTNAIVPLVAGSVLLAQVLQPVTGSVDVQAAAAGLVGYGSGSTIPA